jgi:DNA replicative helicase MCM subunit Mcm2 (Cdc46/Mcm family)
VLEIIREIEEEYGSAMKQEIIERAREEGISEKDVEMAIKKLKDEGHIYEPRRDERYKVV